MKLDEFKIVVHKQLDDRLKQAGLDSRKNSLEWKMNLSSRGREGAYVIFKVKPNWHGWNEEDGGSFMYHFSLYHKGIRPDYLLASRGCGPQEISAQTDIRKVPNLSAKIDKTFALQYNWFIYFNSQDVITLIHATKEAALLNFEKFVSAAVSTEKETLREIFFGSPYMEEWCKTYGITQ